MSRKRQWVMSCGALGGRSPKTGKPVGERHRWSGRKWGEGHCEFCLRTLDQVMTAPQGPQIPPGSTAHLERAIESGD